MLSRIERFNELMKKNREEKKSSGENEDWDWREEWMLLGSDVVSLFPSMSAKNTARILKEQIRKSP